MLCGEIKDEKRLRTEECEEIIKAWKCLAGAAWFAAAVVHKVPAWWCCKRYSLFISSYIDQIYPLVPCVMRNGHVPKRKKSTGGVLNRYTAWKLTIITSKATALRALCLKKRISRSRFCSAWALFPPVTPAALTCAVDWILQELRLTLDT